MFTGTILFFEVSGIGILCALVLAIALLLEYEAIGIVDGLGGD